jgi:predicted nuclease of predicted toxin-antitoxin system
MTESTDLVLDEHVSRMFERVLRERGYRTVQAKDHLGEQTDDRELLRWCGENNAVLVSNNAKDFADLHTQEDHAGMLLYRKQSLPDDDPEGLARAVDAAIEQYGTELRNRIVELDEWYEWLHD